MDPEVIRAREESRRIVVQANVVVTDLLEHVQALRAFIQEEGQ